MSISLTYNGTLSRVQISLSGLSEDAVRVERSTNELFWETVRGGTALPVVSGAASLNDYEFAANTQNFYRVLDVEDLEGGAVESGNITPEFDDCEVWVKSIRYPLLNVVDKRLMDYSDLERPGRTGVYDISGRSFPVATTDVGTSLRFELVFNTEAATAARKLQLALALGDVLFLHVPPNGNPQLPPHSMYFVSQGQVIQRFSVGEKRYTRVQAVEVAPPGPDVVGTTLVWGTVFNQYATWNQLVNANPTWGDLLATVGSPDDLVVI